MSNQTASSTQSLRQKLYSQVESATEALFSTLVMTIEIVLVVGRIHSFFLSVVVSFQQKIVREQGERIQKLEEDSGSLKKMLQEMQEQTREMQEQTSELKRHTMVMKEAYDKQTNMLQEALSALLERKAV